MLTESGFFVLGLCSHHDEIDATSYAGDLTLTP